MRVISAVIVAIGLTLSMFASTSTANADTASPPSNETTSNSSTTAAAAHAYNKRDVWLTFPTWAGAEACQARNIYLASGWYMWRQFGYGHQNIVQRTNTADRRIYLAAGWYHWKDCVHATSNGGYTYFHDTYLRQRSTGGYAHLDRPHLEPLTWHIPGPVRFHDVANLSPAGLTKPRREREVLICAETTAETRPAPPAHRPVCPLPPRRHRVLGGAAGRPGPALDGFLTPWPARD